jgi:hypothetical protein
LEDASSLEVFSLEIQWRRDYIMKIISPVVQKAPRLCHIDLHWDHHTAPSVIDMPHDTYNWNPSLTSISVTTTLTYSIIHLLWFSPAITRLQLTPYSKVSGLYDLNFMPEYTPISLSQLRILQMCVPVNNYLALRYLNFHSLSVLCLWRPEPMPGFNEHFCSFLPRYLEETQHSLQVLITTGIKTENLAGFLHHPSIAQIPTVEIIYGSNISIEALEEIGHAERNFGSCGDVRVEGDISIVGWVDEAHRSPFRQIHSRSQVYFDDAVAL